MSASERVPIREFLRPVKWSNAMHRRAFAAGLPRRVQMHPRPDTAYVGTGYGGWPVPLGVLDGDSIVYSVGAGGDVSFDLGLIDRTGCEVHSFDPTPEAAAHVGGHNPRLAFHNVAIWTRSGELEMYRAASPENMALSAVNLQHTDRSVVVPCRTIESMRAELGHDEIHLLKLTVDGGEYDLLPTLGLLDWNTRVLVVALHHNRTVGEALALIECLAGQGFLPVARKGTGYTFARRGGARP